jgi:hypothetical protein
MKECNKEKCFFEYLGRKIAPVLSEVKPSVLLAFSNSHHLPDRQYYDCFENNKNFFAALLGVDFLILKKQGKNLQVLFYDRAHLKNILNKPGVRKLLARQGYPREQKSLQADLEMLRRRFVQDKGFPHEIGVFLGYPLKDVAGYMYKRGNCVHGPRNQWCIFGQPEPSLNLMRSIRHCEKRFGALLEANMDFEHVLNLFKLKGERRAVHGIM